MLEAAAHGEARLHVSSLAGDVLSLGAFHREPLGAMPPLRWRRLTGGRAAPAGAAFRVITLALPHRSALTSDRRQDLRPEQALNRAVRGLLATLEMLGIAPIYPGLDLVTAGGRALAQLGLAERPDGAALFQALLAWDDSFACTPALLDRADPEGRIPMSLGAAASFTTVLESAPGAARHADVGAFAEALAQGYRSALGVEVAPDQTGDGPGEREASHPPAEANPLPGVEPASGASEATVAGRIGPVTAWLTALDGRIVAAGLFGDFLAPLDLPAALGRRLEGRSPARDAIAPALAGWLDGRERYLLGLREPELVDLLATAAARAQARSEARG